MNLTFLGSGACFYPSLHNTSAYFVYNNNLVLLDCGETVYERLLGEVDISKYDQIYVVLTHLHADHVGSLGSLISYCACILKRIIKVIYPQDTVCKLLAMMGIVSENYIYQPMLADEVEGLSIVPVPVHHAEDMNCYGYEIQCEEMHIYYSGDAADIPSDILKKFKAGEIKRLYQDTATKKTEHHMYIGNLESAIPLELRKNVTCMHLDSDCRGELKEKGFGIVE